MRKSGHFKQDTIHFYSTMDHIRQQLVFNWPPCFSHFTYRIFVLTKTPLGITDPAGLVNVKLSNGEYLVKNKQLTSFTDNEEREGRDDKVVPFLLETKLTQNGAVFKAADNWKENVIADGRLITGQNPASARKVAMEIIRLNPHASKP